MTPSPAHARLRNLASPGANATLRSLEPLAGVSSEFVTAATRRVAWQCREEGVDTTDGCAAVLAALALAVDRQRPAYVSQLMPRPSPALSRRLLDMLRTELVRGWSDAESSPSPSVILGTLSALEQVRKILESDAAQQLSSPLAGPDGLDLLVEVMHDLRSPLTSILFLADTLQRGRSGEVTELQGRQLGLIYSAALGLSSVVSDAVELARGGDELAEKALTPFSVAEILDSVRAIVLPMAHEKGLNIRLVAPDSDNRLGNPIALSRVLLNLTTNALKFTDKGFVEIRSRETDDAWIEFSVRDTGPGIDPAAMAHLFQPFRPNRERKGYCFSGTGLGLAITQKLIAAMGSELRFETKADWGVRFFFELELPSAPGVLAPPSPRDLAGAAPARDPA